MKNTLGGVYTALITPFRDDGAIDWDALRKLFAHSAAMKVRGLVIGGTTAETATLSADERRALYAFARKESERSELDLIAGTGTNDTSESVAWTRHCGELGYRKFLVVTPYYNKPNQRGMIAHYRAVSEAAAESGGSVILYNVPGRTNVSLAPETVATLAQIPNIIGIKEATGNLALLSEMRELVLAVRPDFAFLSGDDPTYFPFLCLGGTGTISVLSHIAGAEMVALTKAVASGRLTEARNLHERLFPFSQALFVETNPAPVKWCLAELGFCRPHLRLPLVPVSRETTQKLKNFVVSSPGQA